MSCARSLSMINTDFQKAQWTWPRCQALAGKVIVSWLSPRGQQCWQVVWEGVGWRGRTPPGWTRRRTGAPLCCVLVTPCGEGPRRLSSIQSNWTNNGGHPAVIHSTYTVSSCWIRFTRQCGTLRRLWLPGQQGCIIDPERTCVCNKLFSNHLEYLIICLQLNVSCHSTQDLLVFWALWLINTRLMWDALNNRPCDNHFNTAIDRQEQSWTVWNH